MTDIEARQRIREDITNSFAVEAGAGTGKTTLLSDRFMALLRQFKITQLPALTFTEKAAAELADRIRSRIESALATAEFGQPALRLIEALGEIDRAPLCTLHAFAAGIVREFALDLDIDPDFQIIEPTEEEDKLLDVFIKEMNRSDEQRDRLLARMNDLKGKLTDLPDFLTKLYRRRDLLESFSRSAKPPSARVMFEELKADFKEWFDHARAECENYDDKGYNEALRLNSLLPVDPIREGNEIWNWITAVEGLRADWGAKGNWLGGESCARHKELAKRLKEKAAGMIRDARRETLEQLIDWLKAVIDNFADVKRTQGAMGFHDVLTLARNLLSQHPAAAGRLQERFQRLLIDEFQDTDPLQVEIARILASDRAAGNGSHLPPPSAGKLFIVGDPQQSIYRFRRADLDVYQASVEAIEATGQKVLISVNFRSAPGLIEFFNAFFAPLWAEFGEGNYHPLEPDPAKIDLPPHPPVKFLAPTEAEFAGFQNVDNMRRAEAQAIASAIVRACGDGGWTVSDFDEAGKATSRRATFDDIAILFPTTKNIDIYTEALTEAGIDFSVQGGKGFYRRPVVIDIYNCIAALDNPGDRLAVIGALRSRLFGVKDADLAAWYQLSGGRLDYREPAEGLKSELTDALKTLRDLNLGMRAKPGGDTIAELFSALQTKYVFWALPNSRQDWEAAEWIIARAREHSGGYGLRGFKRWLKNRLEAEDELEISSESDPGSGVKLMTVHAAKGLEFPIVMLANLPTKSKPAPNIVSNRAKICVEARFGNKHDGYFQTAGYEALELREKDALLAESLRLLYVAMTRARDHLAVPLYHLLDGSGVPKGEYAKWIKDFFCQEGAFAARVEIPLQILHTSNETGEKREKFIKRDSLGFSPEVVWDDIEDWERERVDRLGAVMETLPRVVLPSSHGNALITDAPENRGSKHPLQISSIGSAVHEYMALARPGESFDGALAGAIAARHGVEMERVKPLTLNCLSSALWREAQGGRRFWREVPVAVEFNGELVRGVVDLVWEDDERLLHIVDYKTGAREDQRHAVQIGYYRNAVEKATGVPVVEAALYYAGEDEVVRIVEK